MHNIFTQLVHIDHLKHVCRQSSSVSNQPKGRCLVQGSKCGGRGGVTIIWGYVRFGTLHKSYQYWYIVLEDLVLGLLYKSFDLDHYLSSYLMTDGSLINSEQENFTQAVNLVGSTEAMVSIASGLGAPFRSCLRLSAFLKCKGPFEIQSDP